MKSAFSLLAFACALALCIPAVHGEDEQTIPTEFENKLFQHFDSNGDGKLDPQERRHIDETKRQFQKKTRQDKDDLSNQRNKNPDGTLGPKERVKAKPNPSKRDGTQTDNKHLSHAGADNEGTIGPNGKKGTKPKPTQKQQSSKSKPHPGLSADSNERKPGGKPHHDQTGASRDKIKVSVSNRHRKPQNDSGKPHKPDHASPLKRGSILGGETPKGLTSNHGGKPDSPGKRPGSATKHKPSKLGSSGGSKIVPASSGKATGRKTQARR